MKGFNVIVSVCVGIQMPDRDAERRVWTRAADRSTLSALPTGFADHTSNSSTDLKFFDIRLT